MPGPADTPTEVLPEFSSADIVKLYAATFLPLCQMLATSGMVSQAQIAETISTYVPPTETAPWAQLARALVNVLDRAPVEAEDAALSQAAADAEARLAVAPRTTPDLVVVPGGRS